MQNGRDFEETINEFYRVAWSLTKTLTSIKSLPYHDPIKKEVYEFLCDVLTSHHNMTIGGVDRKYQQDSIIEAGGRMAKLCGVKEILLPAKINPELSRECAKAYIELLDTFHEEVITPLNESKLVPSHIFIQNIKDLWEYRCEGLWGYEPRNRHL